LIVARRIPDAHLRGRSPRLLGCGFYGPRAH
jgi:hypothetical protein